MAADKNLAGVQDSDADQRISCSDCGHAVHGIHASTRKHKLICTFFGCEALSPCQHYVQIGTED